MNIEVNLTSAEESHCFKLTFEARVSPDSDEPQRLIVYLHTTQAIELQSQLGVKLSEYFDSASAELLEIRARALGV